MECALNPDFVSTVSIELLFPLASFVYPSNLIENPNSLVLPWNMGYMSWTGTAYISKNLSGGQEETLQRYGIAWRLSCRHNYWKVQYLPWVLGRLTTELLSYHTGTDRCRQRRRTLQFVYEAWAISPRCPHWYSHEGFQYASPGLVPELTNVNIVD